MVLCKDYYHSEHVSRVLRRFLDFPKLGVRRTVSETWRALIGQAIKYIYIYIYIYITYSCTLNNSIIHKNNLFIMAEIISA